MSHPLSWRLTVLIKFKNHLSEGIGRADLPVRQTQLSPSGAGLCCKNMLGQLDWKTSWLQLIKTSTFLKPSNRPVLCNAIDHEFVKLDMRVGWFSFFLFQTLPSASVNDRKSTKSPAESKSQSGTSNDGVPTVVVQRHDSGIGSEEAGTPTSTTSEPESPRDTNGHTSDSSAYESGSSASSPPANSSNRRAISIAKKPNANSAPQSNNRTNRSVPSYKNHLSTGSPQSRPTSNRPAYQQRGQPNQPAVILQRAKPAQSAPQPLPPPIDSTIAYPPPPTVAYPQLTSGKIERFYYKSTIRRRSL